MPYKQIGNENDLHFDEPQYIRKSGYPVTLGLCSCRRDERALRGPFLLPTLFENLSLFLGLGPIMERKHSAFTYFGAQRNRRVVRHLLERVLDAMRNLIGSEH